MSTRKKNAQSTKMPKKDVWHTIDLQFLQPDKFAYVTNMVLKGRYTLLGLKTHPLEISQLEEKLISNGNAQIGMVPLAMI